MTFYGKLGAVQAALKAPKGQENKFGGYRYRSCEDILEAVKPLLKENGLALTISDDMVLVGERYYIRATATVTDGECVHSVTAYAREPESRKGMDEAQVTGSSSSYARKYALNGLFCIDDTRDPDATNDHGRGANPKAKVEGNTKAKVEGSAKQQEKGRDYTELAELKRRWAAATGQTEQDAGRAIVHTYGNPSGMSDAAYRAMILAVAKNVETLEATNG